MRAADLINIIQRSHRITISVRSNRKTTAQHKMPDHFFGHGLYTFLLCDFVWTRHFRFNCVRATRLMISTPKYLWRHFYDTSNCVWLWPLASTELAVFLPLAIGLNWMIHFCGFLTVFVWFSCWFYGRQKAFVDFSAHKILQAYELAHLERSVMFECLMMVNSNKVANITTHNLTTRLLARF